MRTVLAPIAAALLIAGSATSATAADKTGSCPGPFQSYTLPQLRVLALEVFGPGSEGEADNVFSQANRNGDAVICVLDLRDAGQGDPHRFNFIDNNAR